VKLAMKVISMTGAPPRPRCYTVTERDIRGCFTDDAMDAMDEGTYHMTKRLTSTILLLLIGVGFGIYSVYRLSSASGLEDRIQAILYFGVAVIAFVALLRLPFRADTPTADTPTADTPSADVSTADVSTADAPPEGQAPAPRQPEAAKLDHDD
jgi:hypothetical protein